MKKQKNRRKNDSPLIPTFFITLEIIAIAIIIFSTYMIFGTGGELVFAAGALFVFFLASSWIRYKNVIKRKNDESTR